MFAFARLLFALALFAIANVGFAAPPKPTPKTTPPTAQDVDRNPIEHVGSKIAIDVYVQSIGRRDIDVRLENRVKPTNLKFQMSLSLADELSDRKKSQSMLVRVFGSLYAPTESKGKYVVEVDEIGILNGNREVVATLNSATLPTTIKPVVAATPTPLPKPLPTRATPVATAPTPIPTQASVVVPPTPTVPTATDTPVAAESLPIVPMAGGLAIAVGGAFAFWMLRKRKPTVPAPAKMTALPQPLAQPAPNLPMQIDTPKPVLAPSVRDRLAQR